MTIDNRSASMMRAGNMNPGDMTFSLKTLFIVRAGDASPSPLMSVWITHLTRSIHLSIFGLKLCSILRSLIIPNLSCIRSSKGFLFGGTRILTYFYGGKRKYSIYFNGYRTQNSEGNGNIFLEGRKTEIFNIIVTEI